MSVTEQKISLQRIVDTVCVELGIRHAELTNGRRSTIIATNAKQLCIYFAKHYSDATNAEINTTIGLNKGKVRKSDTRAIRHHLEQLDTKLKQKTDVALCESFDCIKLKLFGAKDRLFRMGEELQINIRTITDKPETNPEYRQLMQKGIYPFVLRYEKHHFYGYARDISGAYIGQHKQAYEANVNLFP